MPGVDQELADFHLIVDDSDAMYLTELVRGHQDIHVYVEHPIHDPILVDEGQDVGEGVQPLALEQDFTGYYDNDDESEHDDDDDGDEFYSFYENDDMYANDQTFNNEDELEVNADVPTEVAASQMGSRRVGKEPIIEHPPEVFHINDSSDSVGSDGRGSGLEGDVELNHGVKDIVEDSSDSWDTKDDAEVNEPRQMGVGVMNSDYESEELHNLAESSSNDELGCDSDDKSEDDNRTHVGDEREPKKEQVRKFPVFKPMAKAEHIYFEKDMMFTTPKQFKEAITDYAVSGGWGIKFVKNDLQRVRVACQEGCKFVAYLTNVPRERSYQLRTLTLEHTCCRSYKNPRCTSSYIGKKLMKKVKRQPNMKLKDIQEAIHDKYTVNISVRKAGRARDKAQEYVDEVYTQQYNQLWEYCEELRRASPGSTILMKGLVQTFIDNWQQFEHMIYCRHLYNNFRKNHSGVLLRELFWRAAKATYKEEFDRVMDELKGIDAGAHSWFQENRVKILRVESDICAKVLKRLHKEKLAANRWPTCIASSTPSAPPQSSMHGRATPTAPSQGKTSSATQFAPSQTMMHQSSPNANMHSFSSTPSALPQSSMHG
nr:hypothetical protein CFP56_61672 [Quercus suber]